jgi:hypothetical protein
MSDVAETTEVQGAPECTINIEFMGPGSAIVKNMHFSPGVFPTQLLVAAALLELEGKQTYIDQRNRMAIKVAEANSILKPRG